MFYSFCCSTLSSFEHWEHISSILSYFKITENFHFLFALLFLLGFFVLLFWGFFLPLVFLYFLYYGMLQAHFVYQPQISHFFRESLLLLLKNVTRKKHWFRIKRIKHLWSHTAISPLLKWINEWNIRTRSQISKN